MPLIAARKKIARSFGAASKSYDVSARLQRHSGKNLMPFLPQDSDKVVLDLGCGTGFFTDILASHYHQVIGIDISTSMLAFSQQKCRDSVRFVQGDAFHLPLLDNCLDIVYSNLVLQWCNPLSKVINEIMRVLQPGGTLVFSTLLEGTLVELKQAWASVDNDKHVNEFLTESALKGELDLTSGLLLSCQSQNIVLEYEDVFHLAHELKGLGANHVPLKKNKGLAGKEKWQRMCDAYESFKESSGVYPATYHLASIVMQKAPC